MTEWENIFLKWNYSWGEPAWFKRCRFGLVSQQTLIPGCRHLCCIDLSSRCTWDTEVSVVCLDSWLIISLHMKWFKDNPVSSARFLLLNVKRSALCCLSRPSASHPDVEGVLRQSETMKAAAQCDVVYETTKSQEGRRSGWAVGHRHDFHPGNWSSCLALSWV